MSSLSTRAWALGLVCAAAGGLAPPASAGTEPMHVCVDQASPTSKFDRAVASAVAERVGTTADISAFDGTGDDDGGFSPKRFARMAETRCDVIMGFPVPRGAAVAPDNLKTSSAYLDTGYLVVTRGTQPTSLDDLPDGDRVAVAYQTPANLLLLDKPALKAIVVDRDADGLRELERGKVDAALVWEASLRRMQEDSDTAPSFAYAAVSKPHARWSLVGLYAADRAIQGERFNRGLKALQADDAAWQRLQQRIKPMQAASGDTAAKSGGGSGDGLYTAVQARMGSDLYQQNCAKCHGAKMEGVVGPALKGSGFADPSYNFTVGGMFTFMATQMPAGAPGSLKKEQYAAIMAYLLKENGYHSGDHELTYEGAMKSKHPLVWHGDEEDDPDNAMANAGANR